MSATDVTIANKALALVGANTISTFDGEMTEQVAATQLYEMMYEAALTAHRWRFATGKAQLTRKAETPLSHWDAAYSMPSQPRILLLNGVSVLDAQIEYDRFENDIYCNAAEADTVVADYIYQVNEADLPPYFVKAFVYDLASAFATAITQDASVALLFEQLSTKEWSKARFAESSSQTARHVNARSLINKRRG